MLILTFCRPLISDQLYAKNFIHCFPYLDVVNSWRKLTVKLFSPIASFTDWILFRKCLSMKKCERRKIIMRRNSWTVRNHRFKSIIWGYSNYTYFDPKLILIDLSYQNRIIYMTMANMWVNSQIFVVILRHVFSFS